MCPYSWKLLESSSPDKNFPQKKSKISLEVQDFGNLFYYKCCKTFFCVWKDIKPVILEKHRSEKWDVSLHTLKGNSSYKNRDPSAGLCGRSFTIKKQLNHKWRDPILQRDVQSQLLITFLSTGRFFWPFLVCLCPSAIIYFWSMVQQMLPVFNTEKETPAIGAANW